MKKEIKIYDKTRLIQSTDAIPGMIIEAMPKSYSTGDLFIPVITTEPTGVFGYIIGEVVKADYAFSDYKLGVTIVDRILFDRELDERENKLMPYSFDKWSNDLGVCKLIGELSGVEEKDIKRGGYHLDYFNKKSIVLSCDSRKEIKKSLIEFRKQRGKKEYVFKGQDGKDYSLNEILLNLNEKTK